MFRSIEMRIGAYLSWFEDRFVLSGLTIAVFVYRPAVFPGVTAVVLHASGHWFMLSRSSPSLRGKPTFGFFEEGIWPAPLRGCGDIPIRIDRKGGF
jgi:hypothetical protein